ncbi:MAG: AraC family transcriptional regulator [Ruminococcus sp.]|nr:AraC family transcriptional regulator [Ruminococcus sp.]
MNTNRDLNYRLFVQKETGFTRTAFHDEIGRYQQVIEGDVAALKALFSQPRDKFFEGKGQLSDDPLRNMMYHLVVGVAVITRMCVDAGMEHNVAYTLSDIYIKRGDKCRTPDAVLDVMEEYQLDFAQRMKEVRKGAAISLHVKRCSDYIYEHLHETVTLTGLAKREKLNPSYLSKLFSKELGVGVKDYIIKAKIDTAKNILRYSDFSILDISISLGYSSQSAFTAAFRKLVGMTPKKYRDVYFTHNEFIGGAHNG